jgi:nucleotide-binding universal stress UspA family protein
MEETMTTYRIVVGVDGSEGGERALNWAVAEAAKRGGTVEAVIAWSWDGVDNAAATSPTEARERAERTLTQAVTAAHTTHPTVTIARESVEGRAAPALIRAAADADLLVLGSHGHGRLFHAVVGSVTDECIRSATCPVVVVPVPRPQRVPAPAEVQVAQ